MGALLASARAGRGRLLAVRDGGRLAGVLVAAPPGAYPFPPPPLRAQLRIVLGQGFSAAGRWRAVFDALDAVHPVVPHWYLATLGVDVACQGRGLGRALLAHWLREVDASGIPTYLETDLPRNTAFYEGAGFHLLRQIHVLETPVWLLQRPAPALGDVPA